MTLRTTGLILAAMIFLFMGAMIGISIWIGLWRFYLAMVLIVVALYIVSLIATNVRDGRPPLYCPERKRDTLMVLFVGTLFGACVVLTRLLYPW